LKGKSQPVGVYVVKENALGSADTG
jgi:hypothetical protein